MLLAPLPFLHASEPEVPLGVLGDEVRAQPGARRT
jgi:hypothetical protein